MRIKIKSRGKNNRKEKEKVVQSLSSYTKKRVAKTNIKIEIRSFTFNRLKPCFFQYGYHIYSR